MDNKNFIKYANSFQAVSKLRLESIRELSEKLGNPQDSLKFIHVAGTNGKGSCCCFLQNILTDAGYRTGRYLSPNMLKVNERISIDAKDISDSDLERILSLVKVKASEMEDMPTQFEIWTAAAFCYFKEQHCDFVVLETGLGGERDATNIIKNPEITVITKIAMDHTDYLGDTIEDIAGAKAGIIKKCDEKGYTVTLPQEERVMKVLKEKAYECDNNFVITKNYDIHDYNGKCEVFDYDNIKNIEVSLKGTHQIMNASLAIECAKILGIDEKYIKSGIKKAKNPGRLDIIHHNPDILFDGAHNKNGMASLAESILRYYKNTKKCFIMGFMRDKDIKGAVNELIKRNVTDNCPVFTVQVKNNARAATSDELAEILKENNLLAISCKDIKDAVEKAKEYDLCVMCGSLYLYKDFFEDFPLTVDKKPM